MVTMRHPDICVHKWTVHIHDYVITHADKPMSVTVITSVT